MDLNKQNPSPSAMEIRVNNVLLLLHSKLANKHNKKYTKLLELVEDSDKSIKKMKDSLKRKFETLVAETFKEVEESDQSIKKMKDSLKRKFESLQEYTRLELLDTKRVMLEQVCETDILINENFLENTLTNEVTCIKDTRNNEQVQTDSLTSCSVLQNTSDVSTHHPDLAQSIVIIPTTQNEGFTSIAKPLDSIKKKIEISCRNKVIGKEEFIPDVQKCNIDYSNDAKFEHTSKNVQHNANAENNQALTETGSSYAGDLSDASKHTQTLSKNSSSSIEHVGNESVPRKVGLKEGSKREFVCDECGHTSSYKENVVKHKKIKHLKVKDLKCPDCDFETNVRTNLKQHIKAIHDKIRDHMCDHCETSFTQKINLLNHVSKLHAVQIAESSGRSLNTSATTTKKPKNGRENNKKGTAKLALKHETVEVKEISTATNHIAEAKVLETPLQNAQTNVEESITSLPSMPSPIKLDGNVDILQKAMESIYEPHEVKYEEVEPDAPEVVQQHNVLQNESLMNKVTCIDGSEVMSEPVRWSLTIPNDNISPASSLTSASFIDQNLRWPGEKRFLSHPQGLKNEIDYSEIFQVPQEVMIIPQGMDTSIWAQSKDPGNGAISSTLVNGTLIYTGYRSLTNWNLENYSENNLF